MSEEKQENATDESLEENSTAVEPSKEQKDQNSSSSTVKKGSAGVILLILMTLVWYLTSDRFTPYTQQARIDGFVIGVAPKVGGVVTGVFVKNNQIVKQDQPLFEIDPSQFQIALEKTQSDLQSTENKVAADDAGIESAQSNLLAAEANALRAKQDAERQERLYKKDKGAISVRRLEMAQASLKQAVAKVASSEAKVQRAIEQKGGEGKNNAQLKSARSAVEKAMLDLENTMVKATSGGKITDLSTDVGRYAAAGNAVLTLITIQDVWIKAEFTENNLGHMRAGTPVDIVVDAIPGKIFKGKIRSIGLGVSAGTTPAAGNLPTIENNRDWLRQSQRYPVMVDFDDLRDQRLKDHLRIGGQVEVMAYTESGVVLNTIGRLYIRLMSWFSYAY